MLGTLSLKSINTTLPGLNGNEGLDNYMRKP